MKNKPFNPAQKSVCEWAIFHLNAWHGIDPYSFSGPLPYTFDWLEVKR